MIFGLDEIFKVGQGIVGAKAFNLSLCSIVCKEFEFVKFPLSAVIETFYCEKIFNGTTVALSKELKEKFYNYKCQRFGESKIIVRSSAKIEDSKFFSGAGQYESYLNINNYDRFIEAICKVYESNFSSNTLLYAEIYDKEIRNDNMAILLQEMIEVEYSGVMYTRNPIRDSVDEVLLEFSRRDGSKVASGEINSITYVISEEQYNIEGVELTENMVRKLYFLARFLEKKFENSLDIEWGISREQIYIFQARPLFSCKNIPYNVSEQHLCVQDEIEGNIISTGISLGVAGTKWILIGEETIFSNEINKLLNCSAAIISTGGKLSHFSSIMREFSKPCLLIDKKHLKKITGRKIVIDGYLGKIFLWNRLNRKQKAKYFFESLYFLSNSCMQKTAIRYGIYDISVKTKYESIYMEPDAITTANNYLCVSEYTQESTTFDFEGELLADLVLVRMQKYKELVRLQVKKIIEEKIKYRREINLYFYFKSDNELYDFCRILGLKITGVQQRKVKTVQDDKVKIKWITWPNAGTYIGFESEEVEDIFDIVEKNNFHKNKLRGLNGKELFELLALPIETLLF